jgi:hypothetical protein
MTAYAEYLRWGVVCVTVALGAWRFIPLGIVRLVAAFTRSETRHRQCMEVLRLARKDAASLPSYITGPVDGPKEPRRRPRASATATPKDLAPKPPLASPPVVVEPLESVSGDLVR